MVAEIRTSQVTIPAGTAQASPLVTATAFPSRIVTWVEFTFPPGPRGNVGIRYTMNGDPVIPLIAGTWLVGDNDKSHWDLDGYPDSGAWQLTAYNTGQYDHTIYLRWGLDYLPQAAPPPTMPIPADTLGGIVALP